MTQKKQPTEKQPTETPPISAEKTAPPTDEPTEVIGDKDPISTEEATVAVRRSYGYWILTVFVIFTASLASVSWFGWKLLQTNVNRINHQIATQQTDQHSLTAMVQNTHEQLAALDNQLTKTREQISKTQTETQHTAQVLDGRLVAFEKNLTSIQNRLGKGERAWKAAEIGFLLTRAQERLSISYDPTGAAVALKLADQRLAALAMAQTIPVRAAISDALAGLKKADDFDAVGMALRLRRAAQTIEQWPLIGTKIPANTPDATSSTPPQRPADAPTAPSAPWYVRWPNAVWHPVTEWFGRQFTLTRSDEPVKASARSSDDRETRLWLTAVREGLLSGDTHQLLPAIQQAKQWITEHYNTNDPDVERSLKALTQTQAFYAGRQWPSFAPIFKAWAATGLEHPVPATSTGVAQTQEAQP